jgi:hypothetical protein
MEVGLCDYHAVFVDVSPNLFSNSWTNVNETWFVYNGT